MLKMLMMATVCLACFTFNNAKAATDCDETFLIGCPSDNGPAEGVRGGTRGAEPGTDTGGDDTGSDDGDGDSGSGNDGSGDGDNGSGGDGDQGGGDSGADCPDGPGAGHGHGYGHGHGHSGNGNNGHGHGRLH